MPSKLPPEKQIERRATPDLLPRFQRKTRFDSAPQGERGRDNAPQIERNELGPHCHLDGPARGEVGRKGGHLGTGSDSVKDAGDSIPSGAKAPKVDWNHLKRA
jgi:hypothetical protein